MKLLILDNYDSFTYNLVQCIEQAGVMNYDVIFNDKIRLQEVDNYDKILLSPGPNIPSRAGIMPELIQQYFNSKSILGVCLGHQAIAEAFGGEIGKAPEVLHGVVSKMEVLDDEEYLFSNMPREIEIGRYHSWVVKEINLPDDLIITTRSTDGQIMGIRHKLYDVRGVQFHPESIMTKNGLQMIRNWLEK